MSGKESRGLLAAVRRLFGRGRDGPQPAAKGPPQSPAPVPPLRGGAEPLRLRWFKERPVLSPRGQVAAPVRGPRQAILALLAAASVMAVIVVFSARGLSPRTMPREVRGVWRTDALAYRGRHFEVRARRLAFQTGDSGQSTIHTVTRVWQTRSGDSTTLRVAFEHEGEPLEFTLVYRRGPPERIRFAHQRALVWTRAPGGRGLIPGI